MKFSIRDLLLVMVIVALAMGWWVDHRWIASLKRERDAALDDADWLSRQWTNNLESEEELERATRILKKYDAMPDLKATAPNPPKK